MAIILRPERTNSGSPSANLNLSKVWLTADWVTPRRSAPLASVIISGVVALTLSPMMAAYILTKETSESWFAKTIEHVFEALAHGYKAVLTHVIKARFVVVLFAAVIISASAYMYLFSQHELSPEEDQGDVILVLKGPHHINLNYINAFSEKIQTIFEKYPEYANILGIRMQDISDTLAIFIGENYINRISIDGRAYEVIPQAKEEFRLTPEAINSLYVRTSSGEEIPLSTVVTLEEEVEPNKLYQFNQLNSAMFQAIPLPGVTLDAVVDYLVQYSKTQFPPGFSYTWQGETRQYVEESGQLMMAFVLALVFIYLALVTQFNSFRDPFIILISVPLSIFGALIPIYLGYTTVNIYTQIGLVTLIGLISKHGILMVEFANQVQLHEGLNRHDAILKASAVRLRPILMTTAAMVVGLIPLVLSNGAGAASHFSLGIVIVVGMLVGTFFTLFVLPVMYTLLAGEHHSTADKELKNEN